MFTFSFIWCICVNVYVSWTYMCTWRSQKCQLSRHWSYRQLWVAWWWCWKQNLDPIEEQQEFLVLSRLSSSILFVPSVCTEVFKEKQSTSIKCQRILLTYYFVCVCVFTCILVWHTPPPPAPTTILNPCLKKKTQSQKHASIILALGRQTKEDGGAC